MTKKVLTGAKAVMRIGDTKIAEFVEVSFQLNECTCGAKHTGNPNHHSSWYDIHIKPIPVIEFENKKEDTHKPVSNPSICRWTCMNSGKYEICLKNPMNTSLQVKLVDKFGVGWINVRHGDLYYFASGDYIEFDLKDIWSITKMP
jgi:hypothetical protein